LKHKILVDGLALIGKLTGIGRYTYEVSKYLNSSDNFKVSYFYGYHSKNFIQTTKNTTSNIKKILSKIPLLKRVVRKVIFLSSRLFTPSYSLYWQPNFIPNDGIKAKKIVTTVHDFSFIIHKGFHPKERIEYFEKYFFKNIIRSDMLITGSQYSKKEILERLDFKEDKIRVIYHGLDHNIFKIYKDINLNFDIPNKFILSVGSIEPRKNLLGLLKAYTSLSLDIKSEYKLVLVGFKGWKNNELMELIDKNKDNIFYLGFINDIELAKVYNLATCFVFPSFYEGFGLPPLEAMACNTPVIASNATSIPEVCKDAAIYFNPNDINSISQKIKMLLEDKNLQKEMTNKGLKRAKQFSWEKSANEHIKLFKEVLSS